MVSLEKIWGVCIEFYINIIKRIDEFKKKREKQQYINWEKKFTVACDKSPFWNEFNQRETLFRTIGLKRARKIAQDWVYKYDCGQARVLEGWHFWEDEKNGSES